MKGWCENGRPNEAKHFLYSMFWRISQKGSNADIVICKTLSGALTDYEHVEEAVEIFRKILRKGLKAPKQCGHLIDLSHPSDGRNAERIKQLINEVLIKGGIPSLASYNAMTIHRYNENKIVEVDKVIQEMQDGGFSRHLRFQSIVGESDEDMKFCLFEKELILYDVTRYVSSTFKK